MYTKRTDNYSDKKQIEINSYINLQNIVLNIVQSPQADFNNIVKLNYNFLNNLANNNTSILRGSAIAILEQTGNYNFEETIKLPTEQVTKSLSVENNTTSNNSFDDLIKVYPNPASDYITVEYAIIEFHKGMKLSLIDIQGKTIKQIPLQYQIGKERFSVNDLEKGTYIINFGNGMYSTKVTIK